MHRNLSSVGSKIDAADNIARMLSNFEDSCEIKYIYLSGVHLSELCEDYSESTSDGKKDSGEPSSEDTITISTTQDDVGTVVHIPASEILMMGQIEGVAQNLRSARQLASAAFLSMAVAWISLLTCIPFLRALSQSPVI